MYHAIILEDLLDVLNAARTYGRTGKGAITTLPEITTRMRSWLKAMTHPDSGISFFNDAAFGIAASCAELEGYAGRLELPESTSRAMASSNWLRLAISGPVSAARLRSSIWPRSVPTTFPAMPMPIRSPSKCRSAQNVCSSMEAHPSTQPELCASFSGRQRPIPRSRSAAKTHRKSGRASASPAAPGSWRPRSNATAMQR